MRIIAHIDMDAFFAAVEERYNPQFAGLPIVVGADPKSGQGRGVVSTANYIARKYGIKSAMPISQAWRLSEAARQRGEPAAVFLQGNHGLYREVSERIMAILREGADAFEEASIDEAYLDVSPLGSFEKAEECARLLKSKILDLESLTCSVGIGPNKLVAKIASDFQKPDGLTVVRQDKVQKFLDPLPIRAIPGIGPKSEVILHQKGVRTISELRALELGRLIEAFGKWGEDLYRKARGISEDPVSNDWEAKSVGEQETFETDRRDPAFILERLAALSQGVFRRFRHEGFRSFRTVAVTIRFADFATTSSARTLPHPASSLEALHGQALRLILPFLDKRGNPRQKAIRLIGVRVEKLSR